MNRDYWQLFTSFFKIGAFTFGGGWAMISVIEKEIVDRHGWIEREEFLDLLAIAQSMPGILAVNIATAIGDKIGGMKGSIVASLGTILPSFLIILGIALFFTQFKDNSWVEKIFKGLRPAVVALIAVPCLTTARSIKLSHKQLIIPIGAALLIWLAGLSPVWIILAAIFGGIIYQKIIVKK